MSRTTITDDNNRNKALKSGFIGNQRDLKKQALTAIIGVNKRVSRKAVYCIKMRGGGHQRHTRSSR
jgi:hypothetical protein